MSGFFFSAAINTWANWCGWSSSFCKQLTVDIDKSQFALQSIPYEAKYTLHWLCWIVKSSINGSSVWSNSVVLARLPCQVLSNYLPWLDSMGVQTEVGSTWWLSSAWVVLLKTNCQIPHFTVLLYFLFIDLKQEVHFQRNWVLNPSTFLFENLLPILAYFYHQGVSFQACIWDIQTYECHVGIWVETLLLTINHLEKFLFSHWVCVFIKHGLHT